MALRRSVGGHNMQQARSLRVLAIGNTIIDTVLTMPEVPVDDKVWIDSKAKFVGGQGANAAQDMALLGLKVSFVTRLGEDAEGRMALGHFEKLGLNTAHCIVVPGAQTMSATVTIATARERRACLMHRDPKLFELALKPHLDQIDLGDYDLVYTDGHQTDLALPIARAAVERGLPLVTDMEVLSEDTRELAELATELVAPTAALQELVGIPDPGMSAMALADRPGRTVIATVGRLGSYGAQHGFESAVHVPSHPNCEVQDTVGAGDAFHAGYLVAIARGITGLRERMAFATAVAAALCETPGPVVSREALLRYGLLPEAE